MIVTRSIEFPMGHRLKDHAGLCRHIHGHNYKVVVGVRCQKLDNQGMVIDFSDLKKEMETVFKPYDHAFVIENGDPFGDILFSEGVIGNHALLGLWNVRHLHVPPTAENLAKHWFHELDKVIGDYDRMWVEYVDVFESTNTSARYTKERV